MRTSPRRLISAFGSLLFLGGLGWYLTTSHDIGKSNLSNEGPPILTEQLGHISAGSRPARCQAIEDAFQHAWDGYARHCMGHDSLRTIGNTCDDDFGGWGATAFDALSTAIIFEKDDIVQQILKHTATIDWSMVTGGSSVQLVEVTNRHLASMLSAYDLLHGPFEHVASQKDLREHLYRQMTELGAVLSCAFSTPTGLPRNWVDPLLCTTDTAHSNTIAGVGSLALEFARLSGITGHRVYVELVQKAERHLLNPQPARYELWPGVLGAEIRIMDGQLLSRKGSWGAMSDSFYEYLLKAYIYNPGAYAFHLQRWSLAVDSTMQYIALHAYDHPEWTLLPYWQAGKLVNAMDAPSWFAGGNIILGGSIIGNQTLVDFGVSIADTAGAVHGMTASGLVGELVAWTEDCSSAYMEQYQLTHCSGSNAVQTTGTKYELRAEIVETWYYAYRATKDPKYREWAWATFVAINTTCRTASGFSSISDVTAIDGGEKLDQMGKVFEVLTYLWLIHVDDDQFPIHVMNSRAGASQWVYNTAGHPLLVADERA